MGTARSDALTIEAASIQTEAELGGLPIRRLTIRQKAGQSRLSFGQASPQSAELLQFGAEGAVLEAQNLANVNAIRISLHGDAATYRLDFGGALQRSTQVEISTRTSWVEITVPASTPTRIASAALLSDLDIGDGFRQQDGVFWTQAAATAARPAQLSCSVLRMRTH